MKIEIINGLAPTSEVFIRGSFIYDRLKSLHNCNLKFEIWMLETSHSKILHLIYHIIYSRKLQDETIIKWDLEERQNIIRYKIPLLSAIIGKFIPRNRKGEVAALDKEMKITSESLIHAHWIYPHGYIATIIAKKHKVPCIVTAHGSDIHSIPRKKPAIKKYVLKTLTSADRVIFVSHALLDSAKELGYSGDNAVVIPNGIDMEYFYPMEKEEALKKTGWKQTKRYVVGFVGNLIPVKRADKFVEIFSEIQKQVQDVEFILVGDGDLADIIRSDVSATDLTVTFTKRVPHEDVCNWMNLFDVMILPSKNESWGCVIQEAYACGVPVVGAAVGGIPENLGGLCPSVVDGDDFEVRFADAVCEVLKGKYPINTNCLISRAGEYTWETTVEKEIEVYLDLVKTG